MGLTRLMGNFVTFYFLEINDSNISIVKTNRNFILAE